MNSSPGFRVIPLAISCLTGESTLATSFLNLLVIFVTLFMLFRTFDFTKKQSWIFSGLFSTNSLVVFPFFYAAAHSYVYTIFASILSLFIIKKTTSINLKSIALLLLAGLSLKLVRSEGVLYFLISLIAYLIHLNLESNSLKVFFKKYKKQLFNCIILLFCALFFNYMIQVFISSQEEISKNLDNTKYVMQFPKDSFLAVSLWATLEYLRAFLTPYYMNFYGHYLDWLNIHSSKMYQYTLYSFILLLTSLSTYFIFSRKKSFVRYFIIGIAIFVIPSFLISSFLRNQWFYPSRSLLGCILSLPFFVRAILSIHSQALIKRIFISTFSFYLITFVIHNTSHFQNEETMYKYETTFLGIKNPTLAKTYSQYLMKEKDFLKAIKVLRETGRDFPEKGIFMSANHFFLWAENLYWSAAGSHFYKSPLTEEKVLKKLYRQPNFFGALACIQDIRIPIEKCKSPIMLEQLCNPIYKKRFGYTFYKKPRIKIERLCSQNQ